MYNPFRQALPFLWDGSNLRSQQGKDEFVCCALLNIETLNPAESAANRAAKEHIAAIIFPSTTVSGWLVDQGVPESKTGKPRLMQHYRKRWLEHMADEFDAGRIKL